jgi:serine protease SohB
MEYLIELGIFAGKAFVVLLVIGSILVLILSMAVKNKPPKEYLEVEKLNHKFDNYKSLLQQIVLSKKDLKSVQKTEKKELKAKGGEEEFKNTIYVIDFEGDINASSVSKLREEVSAILTIAKPQDTVLARVESPGGAVHGYGLAASQLNRFRAANINLVVSVDKVAASGGYLMACIANKIIAAPFAIVGSIGVIAQVPNFNRLLKKNDVDYEEITSGEFKRTVSMFGEITEKGKKKFTEQIEETHALFKEFVGRFRPQLNLSTVATGEYWFGTQAISLKLVDEIKTSDEFLFENKNQANLIKVCLQSRKTIKDILCESIKTLSKGFLGRLMEQRNLPPNIG